jgi:MoxR-like ATPase
MECHEMSGSWDLFVGDGEPRRADPEKKAWTQLPPLRSWRLRQKDKAPVFKMTEGLSDAVNAALHLRRPLLLTGDPGSGKSTLVDVIAAELELGTVLRWHITSKSTLNDGLYEYDALGRLHATQEKGADDAPENFVTLGPLGTALAAGTIRAVLIDELDKSDLDLPGDLLNVIENGEFTIPVLARAKSQPQFIVKGADGDSGEDGQPYTVGRDGVVRRTEFPVIVFTSNRERAFSAPFMRRCIRFQMPRFTKNDLVRIIQAHLDEDVRPEEDKVISEFAQRLQENKPLAVNQILEYVYLVTGSSAPAGEARDNLRDILLKELNGT